MAGFKGKYDFSIDDKGRISLPAKLRKNVSPEAKDGFILTRGFETCIYLYPQNIWNKLEEDLDNRTSEFDENDRILIRTMMMYANDVVIDQQSRIPITPELLSFAKITKKVVIIGVLKKIEIWAAEEFEQYNERSGGKTYEQIASEVMGRKKECA